MNDYYKEKLKQGLHFQDFVVEELYKIGLPIISYSSKEFQNLIGENKAGLEIKNDRNYKTTGNLYIEIAEKSCASNVSFVSSGIYRNDNTWLYLIGDYEKIYVFGKSLLIQLHKTIHKTNKYKLVETATSKGFLLPSQDAIKYSIKTIIPCVKGE